MCGQHTQSVAVTMICCKQRTRDASIALSFLSRLRGVDPDKRNSYGMTAMIKAAKAGRIEIVRYLVKAGANIENHNNFNDTALTEVAETRHTEEVSR